MLKKAGFVKIHFIVLSGNLIIGVTVQTTLDVSAQIMLA